jgi:hypothetical protein
VVIVTPPDDTHYLVGIDVIVRFHDPSLMFELGRAIFSLVGQEYRPIRVLLVLQRFSDEQEAHVHTALAPLLSWADGIELVLLNFQESLPLDARAALLNTGLAAATGRYLAILDYDDTLQPYAYSELIGRLRTGSAAIVFARTPIINVEVNEDFYYVKEKLQPFEGNNLRQLFESNFCPIHSYVMDRHRIPLSLMHFEVGLIIEEDYEFLIRVCATVRSDFGMLHREIGFYTYKNNESNTFSKSASAQPEVERRMTAAREFVALRRRMVYLSLMVQETLGIKDYNPHLSVQNWLDLQKESDSSIASTHKNDQSIFTV